MLDRTHLLLAVLALVLTACPKGERCDMTTYEGGCAPDGRSWSYCSDKDSSGFGKSWPTVARHECSPQTECVEEADVSTCVAAPAERCDVQDDERCVDGASQRCWSLGSQVGAPLYWSYVGLPCE